MNFTKIPKFCPYCGGNHIVPIVEWDAKSQEEPDNTAELTEYQCADCDNISFWC